MRLATVPRAGAPVWGEPSSGPRARSGTRSRRSSRLRGLLGKSSAARAPVGPGLPTRSTSAQADRRPVGFATTTGRIELASEFLPFHGGRRLPEPVLRGPPWLPRRSLMLITGARRQPYNASMYFENPRFRDGAPARRQRVSQKACAEALGLHEGDAVEVATDAGTARFVLAVAAMRDDVVSVDYGWWHPEWGCRRALGRHGRVECQPPDLLRGWPSP